MMSSYVSLLDRLMAPIYYTTFCILHYRRKKILLCIQFTKFTASSLVHVLNDLTDKIGEMPVTYTSTSALYKICTFLFCLQLRKSSSLLLGHTDSKLCRPLFFVTI